MECRKSRERIEIRTREREKKKIDKREKGRKWR
jgi:hypothetical protein